MRDHYTITEYYETEIEIKRSRFINRVYHVKNEAEIETIINQNKKEHYKATHVCFAYVLGTEPERQKSSDAGEPAGTAGKPILEVINQRALKNVLVVVIRYFGGIKLGAGGLIRAYSGGAADVINAAQIIKKQFSDIVVLEIDYTLYGLLNSRFSEKGILPFDQDFGEKVSLSFYVPVAETNAFIADIREATNDRFDHAVLDQCLVDIPV